MLRDFDDYARDGRGLLRPLLDTTGGMVAERMRSGRSPWSSAALALLFVLPFLVLNRVVVFRTRSGVFWLRPGEHTSAQEVVVLLGRARAAGGGCGRRAPARAAAACRGWAMVPNMVVAACCSPRFVLLAVAVLGTIWQCAPSVEQALRLSAASLNYVDGRSGPARGARRGRRTRSAGGSGRWRRAAP